MRKAAFNQIKSDLLSNYYNILADTTPPDCQVEEQTSTKQDSIHNISKESIKTKKINGIIPSIVADSAATSNVGAMKHKDSFILTGRRSTKVFQLPNGTRTAASTISELPFDICKPAKEIHNLTMIDENLLLSIPKTAETGYKTVFNNKEVNRYDAEDKKVLVTRKAILRGWYNKRAKLWRAPLVPIILNKNTDTVFTSKPPTEFLREQSPASKAAHNVYELKTQAELIKYLHVAVGFPTKPTWIKAIKNKQFASWPGLTIKAVTKHFPKSEETLKGHGQKIKSGLRSTK
jgi:hypothetical protein